MSSDKEVKDALENIPAKEIIERNNAELDSVNQEKSSVADLKKNLLSTDNGKLDSRSDRLASGDDGCDGNKLTSNIKTEPSSVSEVDEDALLNTSNTKDQPETKKNSDDDYDAAADEDDEDEEEDMDEENCQATNACYKTQHDQNILLKVAIDILEKYEEFETDTVPMYPEPGNAYVFNKKTVGEKWTDGYEWRNNGSNLQPKRDPKIKKVFYNIRTASYPSGNHGFQRSIYYMLDKPNVILVHYMGDSSVYTATPQRRKRMEQRGVRIKNEDTNNENNLGERSLTVSEAVATLNDYEGHISLSRAVKPKGGEIYIFDRNVIGDDWKCDDYAWRNSGTRYIPSRNPVMRKNFYFIREVDSKTRGCKDFKKCAYYLLDKPNIILVHYIGDESTYVPRAHGNRKKGNDVYVRTCPSVISAIKDCVVNENPVDTYNRLRTTSVEQPRDIKQIRSLKERLTRPNRKVRKRKFPSEVEVGICVAEDGNEKKVFKEELNIMNDENDETQLKDDDLKPLLLQPLDSHPEIRKVQIEILEHQKRILRLQEEKLRLEIEKLETIKENEIQQSEGFEVIEQEQMPANVSYELHQDNQVFYVNNADELMQIASGAFGNSNESQEQLIYVQDEAGNIVQQLFASQQ